MSKTTYIGSYIQLPNVVKKDQFEVNVCSNKMCPTHVSSFMNKDGGKFCVECGSQMVKEKVSRERKGFLTLMDLEIKSREVNQCLIEWTDEFFMVDPENYSGVIMSNKMEFSKNIDDSSMTCLNFFEIKLEMERFRQRLFDKGVAQFLLNHYSFDINSRINYGIASFYH